MSECLKNILNSIIYKDKLDEFIKNNSVEIDTDINDEEIKSHLLELTKNTLDLCEGKIKGWSACHEKNFIKGYEGIKNIYSLWEYNNKVNFDQQLEDPIKEVAANITVEDCIKCLYYSKVWDEKKEWYSKDILKEYYKIFSLLFFENPEKFIQLHKFVKEFCKSNEEYRKRFFEKYIKNIRSYQSNDILIKKIRNCFEEKDFDNVLKCENDSSMHDKVNKEKLNYQETNKINLSIENLSVNEKTSSSGVNSEPSEKKTKIYEKFLSDIKPRQEGYHFVIGDTHGCFNEVKKMLEIIRYDKLKDHVYFLGDYHLHGKAEGNDNDNFKHLMNLLNENYQSDLNKTGFHLIRGNHEWQIKGTININESYDNIVIRNLPDIITIKIKEERFLLAHAGMHKNIFEKIMVQEDVHNKQYQLNFDKRNQDDYKDYYKAVIWVRKNDGITYRDDSNGWPETPQMKSKNAFIIHGHCPVQFLNVKEHGYKSFNNSKISYSDRKRAFNLDSGCGHKDENMEGGLSCLCLETKRSYFVPKNFSETNNYLCKNKNKSKSINKIPIPLIDVEKGNIIIKYNLVPPY